MNGGKRKKAGNPKVTALLSICFKSGRFRSAADDAADVHTLRASVSLAGRTRSHDRQHSSDNNDWGNAAQTGNQFIHIYSGK